MSNKIISILKSNTAKKAYLIIALIFVLFFVCNNMLMPWFVNKSGVVKVPSLVGLTLDQAIRMLDSLNLESRDGGTRIDTKYPAGTVVIQNPIEGAIVKPGRRIYLTVSSGEQQVVVPNLKGRSERDAKFAIERTGLVLASVEYAPSDELPENTIMDQSLPAGMQVKKNSKITVVVSQGKIDDKVAVPDVTGKPFLEAEKILALNGLKVGQIIYQSSQSLLPNTILDQFPRSGELISYGDGINLFIVKGGEQKNEPREY
jgi:serine/threonine-protein kinase